MREKIKPIMLGYIGIAYRYILEALAQSVRHVNADRQKLLEKEEGAECSAGQLAAEREVNGQSKRHKQLEKSSPGNHDPFAEKTEQQVPTLMNGNEDKIEPLK